MNSEERLIGFSLPVTFRAKADERIAPWEFRAAVLREASRMDMAWIQPEELEKGDPVELPPFRGSRRAEGYLSPSNGEMADLGLKVFAAAGKDIEEMSDCTDLITNMLHAMHREGHDPFQVLSAVLSHFHEEAVL